MLNIGLDLGVISPTLFAMMVLMALVTTMMTSPIVRALIPTTEHDRADYELVRSPRVDCRAEPAVDLVTDDMQTQKVAERLAAALDAEDYEAVGRLFIELLLQVSRRLVIAAGRLGKKVLGQKTQADRHRDEASGERGRRGGESLAHGAEPRQSHGGAGAAKERTGGSASAGS